MTTSWRAETGGRAKAFPSRTWWQMRLSSPSTVGGLSVCEDKSKRSAGQPAAMLPATTNLMKSLRLVLTLVSLGRRFDEFSGNLRFTFCAQAQAIPSHDGGERKKKNDAGDSIDFRRNATPQPSPDFQRQRVVASDQEKTDSDFVHGKREDQEGRADDR